MSGRLRLVRLLVVVVVGGGLWHLFAMPAPPPLTTAAPGPCGRGIEHVVLVPGLVAVGCQQPAHLIKSAPLPLVVAVTSPVADHRMRALKRPRWQRAGVHYMFFVGTSDNPAEQEQVADEMQTFGDIVQVSALDSYENLTLKSVGAAAWAWQRYGVQASGPWCWFKTEDYMNNSLSDIAAVVHEQTATPTAHYIAGGMIFGGNPVMRMGRWGCPERHCPYMTFPHGYAGGQYLLNGRATQAIGTTGLASLDLHDPYPIEDHYIAAFLAEQTGTKVTREKRLWWAAGQPYSAPGVAGPNHFLRHKW